MKNRRFPLLQRECIRHLWLLQAHVQMLQIESLDKEEQNRIAGHVYFRVGRSELLVPR